MSLPADTNPMEAVLIGCCPSSGSTLLSLLLDAHPQMICGPELWLFAHPFFWSLKGQAWQERLTRFFRTGAPDYFELPDWNLNHGVCEYADLLVANHLDYYASSLEGLFDSISGCGSGRELAARICAPALRRSSKSIWAEKSPCNLWGIEAFLGDSPAHRAIVMVRDGRDTICSLQKRDYHLLGACAAWLLETAVSVYLARHERVYLLKYEDLVKDPEAELDRICGFLGVPSQAGTMLERRAQSDRAQRDAFIGRRMKANQHWSFLPSEGISSGSVGRWHSGLNQTELDFFMYQQLNGAIPALGKYARIRAVELLHELGYIQSADWPLDEARKGDLIKLGNFMYTARSRQRASQPGINARRAFFCTKFVCMNI
jgi:hypothetical protein